jgi:hypothetical protein
VQWSGFAAIDADTLSPRSSWARGVESAESHTDDDRADDVLLVDLGDGWSPPFLRPDDAAGTEGAVPWYASWIALADERTTPGTGTRAHDDRFFELWGIPPSLSVVQRRLDDEPRHRCHDAVDEGDDASLRALQAPLPVAALGHPGRRARQIAALSRRLDAQRASEAERARLTALLVIDGGARALLAHLVCDGLLSPRDAEGGFGPRAARALGTFQRREALPATERVIDDDTLARLRLGSVERDWLALLRVLRERVADAAGLLADGSAAHHETPVAGRLLDPRVVRAHLRTEPLAHAAGDIVDAATDAVARALGLTDPTTAATTLRALPRGVVAVPRPPMPAWHTTMRDLHIEIDRGDVDGHGLWRPGGRRPTLVVVAVTDDGDIPLCRWPTTTGGWQREKDEVGAVATARKPSPVGEFVWTQLWSQPAWYPPKTTPDDELLLHVDDHVVVAEDSLGPGYRSAYGLVMLPHERARSSPRQNVETGVRTHGTGNVRSVLRGGPSHGCHRLLPMHAHRLATFLLHHRPHRRDGPIVQKWERRFDDVDVVVRRRVRGVRWTFLQPIDVRVVASGPEAETASVPR